MFAKLADILFDFCLLQGLFARHLSEANDNLFYFAIYQIIIYILASVLFAFHFYSLWFMEIVRKKSFASIDLAASLAAKYRKGFYSYDLCKYLTVSNGFQILDSLCPKSGVRIGWSHCATLCRAA